MNVVVCIKQVPSRSVPMDRTLGVLDRSRAGGQLNPWDAYALEAGLRIAGAAGGTVTALTMGPESAESSLRAALSMGADRAVLLCHRAFAGADVYATAFTLAQGIRALGKPDAVVCGQQSTDGDTAQLPFSLAVQLGLPAVGWIKGLTAEHDGTITAVQELSEGVQQTVLTGPCLLAVGAGIGTPRIPSLRDQLLARKKTVERLGLSDLACQEETAYGLQASPTRVIATHEVEQRPGREPMADSPAVCASAILEYWKREGGGR